jgi:hypothetical protein
MSYFMFYFQGTIYNTKVERFCKLTIWSKYIYVDIVKSNLVLM